MCARGRSSVVVADEDWFCEKVTTFVVAGTPGGVVVAFVVSAELIASYKTCSCSSKAFGNAQKCGTNSSFHSSA